MQSSDSCAGEDKKLDSHRQALAGQILHRLETHVQDLRVVTLHGGLVLRGRVKTYYARQRAEHVVLDLTANGRVINDIEVV